MKVAGALVEAEAVAEAVVVGANVVDADDVELSAADVELSAADVTALRAVTTPPSICCGVTALAFAAADL